MTAINKAFIFSFVFISILAILSHFGYALYIIPPETFDTSENWDLKYGDYIGEGVLQIEKKNNDPNATTYVRKIDAPNYTFKCEWQMNWSDTAVDLIFNFANKNYTQRQDDVDEVYQIQTRSDSNQLRVVDASQSGSLYLTTSSYGNKMKNYSVIFTDYGQQSDWYVNETYIGSVVSTTGYPTYVKLSSQAGVTWALDNFSCYNGTKRPLVPPYYVPNISVFSPVNDSILNVSVNLYNYSAICNGTDLINFSLKLSNASQTETINYTLGGGTATGLSLTGLKNLSMYGDGRYISNFSCNNALYLTTFEIVHNITHSLKKYPLNIIIDFPFNNSIVNVSSPVPFVNYSMWCIDSKTITIYMEIANYSTLNESVLYTDTNSTNKKFDKTNRNSSLFGYANVSSYTPNMQYKLNVTCYDNTDQTNRFLLFTTSTTFIEPPPANVTSLPELYSFAYCPMVSLLGVLVWMFFFSIAFGVMGFAYWFKHGFIGAFGGLILLFDSMYIISCVFVIGMLLIAISVFFMFFFISRGYKNEL